LDNWSDFKAKINSLEESEKKQIHETAKLIAKIVQQRLDLGLTQRQLSELSGVKQSAIARLEKNGVIPRIDTLFKLLLPLGLSLELVDSLESD
jgi:transcriptional regulator with XRE-family HTH domain